MSGVEIATKLLDDFTGTKVKELLELRPWMKDKKFILLTKQAAIEKYINICIEKGIVALDLEATGLNTRLDSKGKSYTDIVGICLSHDPNEGIYICVAHEDAAEYNVSLNFIISELKRLAANCILIFHNFKYDGQLLRNYGVIINDASKFEDTYLMAAIEDASRKQKGLKYLSEVLLNRPQLEILDMGIKGNKKDIVAFEMVPPQKAVYYGGSDGMNTIALYLYLKNRLKEVDPTHIYRIEKLCLLVTMEMERNLVKVDIPYLKETLKDVDIRMSKLVGEIYGIAGHHFDLNSTQQLGNVLFNELKLSYPKGFEKTKTGHHQTNSEVLEKIDTKNPIVDLILTYRGYVKVRSTYLLNMINNADENDEVKFQLNQIQADTGRYSGTGGKGLHIDGYSGVNCQNIPTYNSKDPHSINLRRAIIAHPGYKIVSIDYSGEELRIAANFSREPKWIQEFLHGTGDLHTITGQIITGKKDISPKERKTGKILNFLTMYGGGAGGFAAQAKIPYTTAKKMIINFFKEYTGLNDWIKIEWKRSRERKYSLTAFGRRRPLNEFYDSQDRGIQAKGDRCAINSAIQGCLQGHERILTNKGYIPIIELFNTKEHSVLKVWTGTSWETFDVIDRGEAQFAEIELSNGMILNCDTRHEVLTVGKNGYEFKQFDTLDESTEICVSIPTIKEFGRYPLDYHFISKAHNGKELHITTDDQWNLIAYLMGYVIGDGDIREESKHSITLCFGLNKLKNYIKNIENAINDLGLCISNIRKNKNAKGESYQGQINPKGLIDLFIELGYIKATSRNKRVPEIIFRAPIMMRKSFIKGYFDTDGCKKRRNRYGYHTPNIDLLRDIQLIGWTLGLSSIVRDLKNGNYKLEWQDLKKVEELLDLPPTEWKRQNVNNSMLLPEFLREYFKSALRKVYDRKNPNECAYFCKINTGKKVTLAGMLSFMKKYECELPEEIYYHYKLKSKTIIDKKEHTYTLSVHSDLHRFDSAGIISKNTGADIIKIALWRVYKWIIENNFQDDVKILLPVHDEVVYEIKENKLDFYIPEICKIMKIRDLTDKLKWIVPLEVDAEYGDSFHVEYNYWEEISKREEEYNKNNNQKPIESSNSVKIEKKKEEQEKLEEQKRSEGDNEKDQEIKNEIESDTNININTTFSEAPHYFINYMVKDMLIDGLKGDKEAKEELNKTKDNITDLLYKDAHIKDRIDNQGFFNYPIDSNIIVAQKLRFIFETIKAGGDNLYIGPKYRICILNKKGEVLFKSSEEISIDAFLALCLILNI